MTLRVCGGAGDRGWRGKLSSLKIKHTVFLGMLPFKNNNMNDRKSMKALKYQVRGQLMLQTMHPYSKGRFVKEFKRLKVAKWECILYNLWALEAYSWC